MPSLTSGGFTAYPGSSLPAPAEPTGQLDLFSWRPKPRTPMQSSLFWDPPTEPTNA
ncbi:hypothetical protein WMF20_28175 [Sorangium sp. So ce834]|uniref:hypothetical protein n=1 Tax=Sorangium sp. So ce834 TaxID=3133321 RepID=UPI003F63006C